MQFAIFVAFAFHAATLLLATQLLCLLPRAQPHPYTAGRACSAARSQPMLAPHQLKHSIHLLKRLWVRQPALLQQRVGCTAGMWAGVARVQG